jgi:hypothetical protein
MWHYLIHDVDTMGQKGSTAAHEQVFIAGLQIN